MRRIILALALVFFGSAVARAEIDDLKSSTKAPAQTVLTQEQFDALVKAVTDTVTKTLQEQNGQTPSHALMKEDDHRNSIARTLAAMVERAPAVFGSLPAMGAALERLPVRLDRSAQGGLSFTGFLLALFSALSAAWIVEKFVRTIFQSTLQRLAQKVPGRNGLKSLLALNVLDGLRIAAVAATIHMIMAVWFNHPGFQASVMAFALENWLRWRIFAFIIAATLRPDLPTARIAPVSDASAKKLSFWMILTTALVTITRFYSSLFSAPAVLAAALMISTIVVTLTYILFLTRLRTPLSEWFSGLIIAGRRGSGFKLALARNWLALGIPLLLFLAATRFFGALTANVALPAASAMTLNIILAVIILETLIAFITRRELNPESAITHLRPFVLRIAQVIIILSAILLTANIWAVTGLSLMEASEWQRFIESWRMIGFILFGAFFAWEAVRFISARYGAQTTDVMANDDTMAGAPGATRLQTLLPPFRIAAAAAIIIVTVLMVLTSLGINTTPLIAGASVFGLAISFGSQTLVKDIVSGIFFLADDAFRVGEYIDCKLVKGTVEGFTLRSIRLRHQNGQIHTVPFGQLGQITNFSRDWSTVKFNLRFARDTDVDALRKATKKLGQDLANDPELKDQFLAPLKLQGVADIEENALLMRFKFTVKPTNPTYIQRVAIKRMLADFPALGLQFASAPGMPLPGQHGFDLNQPILTNERPQTAKEAYSEAASAAKTS